MTVCQYLEKKGILLQALNQRLYKSISLYYYTQNLKLFKLAYKQLLQAGLWKHGVNEKTFLAKQPSPYNQMVAWEYCGKKQTKAGIMFNMILQDGTRSDNPFIDGDWLSGKEKRYDYFLPQKKRITAVTIYHDGIISGFRFHLSDGSDWDIGNLYYGLSDTVTQTVNIADNEVIVGFNSKSHPDCPAYYVEWQFITAQGLRFN